jgi:NADH:ubiquinone oxidoreductase subunit F (NADH-binding)
LWGKPTVINNVETLANVPEIVREGVDAYRSVGLPASPGTKLYPLSGAVVHAGVMEAPMGATLQQLIFEIGGGIAQGKQFLAALVGGAAGVFLGEDMLNVPLEYDNLASHGAVLGSGAILVLDKSCRVAPLLADILHFFAHESCGQCVPCRVGTVRLVEIMDRFLAGTGTEEDLDLMLDTAQTMKQTSLCPLGQSPHPLLKSAFDYFKDQLLAEQTNGREGRS